jgi:REP element-mobilizing transposase RayT
VPTPGKRWRHIIVNTRNSWLHGDERGFRDRHHRTHSSGDYNRPPTSHEHEGLRDYFERRAGEIVEIPVEQRPVVGSAICQNLTSRGHRLAVVSVSKLHAHVVVELPDDVTEIKRIIGWAKQKSSRAVPEILPGAIWSAGETYKAIDTVQHCRAAVKYVWDQRLQGAWVWKPAAENGKDPGA